MIGPGKFQQVVQEFRGHVQTGPLLTVTIVQLSVNFVCSSPQNASDPPKPGDRGEKWTGDTAVRMEKACIDNPRNCVYGKSCR